MISKKKELKKKKLFLLQSTSTKLQKVEITLQDCLACSGCITSAESVLVTQQSQEEIFRVLNENQNNKLLGNNDNIKIIVFTISQQSILSLSKRYNLNIEDCCKHLSGYLRSIGADYILNTKIADDLSLLECRNEFLERYYNQQQNNDNNQLPMLSSSCPGWVCYAEKTHGTFILPYISTTRSPQQIMGVLVKQYLSKKLNISGNKIYHITIMPCYDKKLEASREDFFNEVYNSRDVDCVITSSKFSIIIKSFKRFLLIKEIVISVEIEQMLNKEEKTLLSYDKSDFDWPWSLLKPEINVWAHEESGSGGYSDHIFKYAAKELFGEEITHLNYKSLR